MWYRGKGFLDVLGLFCKAAFLDEKSMSVKTDSMRTTTSTAVAKVRTLKVLIAWFLSCMAVCNFKIALKL